MTDKQIVRVPPGVFIPDGVDDLKHVSQRAVDEDDGFDETSEMFETDVTYEDDSAVDDTPPVPETFVIISQTVRINADGSQVIDVVFETDDLPGTDQVEVKIVK